MHVTKVYFIQLVLKIKYVEFEDNTKIFNKNLRECESFSQKTDKRFYQKNGKYEHWTTFCESYEQPVRSNDGDD